MTTSPALIPASIGGRALDHSRHQHAAAVLAALQPRLEFQADPTAVHVAVLDQLLHDVLGQIAGNGAAERAERRFR